jgi:ADP-ribose pyrophosphatase YjhB (NUDIX family)
MVSKKSRSPASFLTPKLKSLHVKEQFSAHDVISMFEELVERCWSDKKYSQFLECTTFNPRKPLGTRLFEAIARLSITVAFEAVCLRQNPKTKALEVYLKQRRETEAYAGEWHCPGSVFRPGEIPADVLKRLAKREFKTKMKSDFVCVGDFFCNELRGYFLSRIYLVRPLGRLARDGRWQKVEDALQDSSVVEHHRSEVIPRAVVAWKVANLA